MITTWEKYPVYKSSNVEWLGNIPIHWEVKRLKFLCNIKTGERNTEDKVNDGIYPFYVRSQVPERINSYSYDGEAILTAGDGAGVGKVYHYANGKFDYHQRVYKFSNFKNITGKLLFYYLQSNFYNVAMLGTAKSTVDSLRLPLIQDFEVCFFDNKKCQYTIVNFLDKETARINKSISQKQKMIELLKEHKQIIIQNAVTKGLGLNIKMKDSGVKWLGAIPNHWEVKRLKYVLDERNERSITGKETLFMVSQVHGLVVRADYHEKAEVAESNVGNKKVHFNDLVFNKLKAHLGVFFKSNIEKIGLVSPDYAVYFSKGIITDLKYLEFLFRHPAYIGHFICKATGIVEGLIRLYTADLFDIKIPVPPRNEQEKIITYIGTKSAKIDKAIHLQQEQIEKLKEYKTILINNAVTGKIKVC